MRKPSPALVVSAAALFFAAGGGSYAAVTAGPSNVKLERQITVLTARVAADAKTVTTLREYVLCEDGIMWDSLGQTWYALHAQVAAIRTAAPSWPDYSVPAGTAGESSFDDQGSCAALGVTRPQSIIAHP